MNRGLYEGGGEDEKAKSKQAAQGKHQNQTKRTGLDEGEYKGTPTNATRRVQTQHA